MPDAVSALRAFNRFYTNVIGALREGLVHTPYSLTEGRVIFELAQREATEVADLRRTLDLDAGYLSRILARFEADGLVRRERSETDGRRQVIRLTPNGRAAYTTLDEGSAAEIAAMLHRLNPEHERRYDAEVAPPSPNAPEEVWVLLVTDRHEVAVSRDQIDGEEVITGQPVLSHQPAESAAEGQPANPRRREEARRQRHPERTGGQRRQHRFVGPLSGARIVCDQSARRIRSARPPVPHTAGSASRTTAGTTPRRW